MRCDAIVFPLLIRYWFIVFPLLFRYCYIVFPLLFRSGFIVFPLLIRYCLIVLPPTVSLRCIVLLLLFRYCFADVLLFVLCSGWEVNPLLIFFYNSYAAATPSRDPMSL
jgi:hypothetical protein